MPPNLSNIDYDHLLLRAGIAILIGAIAFRYIAPLGFSIFLYYTTRRLFDSLRKLRLPARVRGAIVLVIAVTPLSLTIIYTTVWLIVEARVFISRVPYIATPSNEGIWLWTANEIPNDTILKLYRGLYNHNHSFLNDFATQNAIFVTDIVLDIYWISSWFTSLRIIF